MSSTHHKYSYLAALLGAFLYLILMLVVKLVTSFAHYIIDYIDRK